MAVITSAGGLTAEAAPYGPDGRAIDAARRKLAAQDPLRRYVDGARWRWLSFRLDEDRAAKTSVIPTAPQLFAATVYDYTHDRSLHVTGALNDLGAAVVTESGAQPLPTAEEFAEAVAIIRADPVYGPGVRRGALKPYRPMPPLLPADLPDGRSHRVLGIGLYAPGAAGTAGPIHQLVGVNLSNQQMAAQPAVQPPATTECGYPLDDSCPWGDLVGLTEIVVKHGRRELWRLVVVRPAGSSGTLGSGLELRYVSYRGESVLTRAHVPILNVQYQSPSLGCGPTYRDWETEESCFDAVGTDIIPGIRLCSAPPRTIVDGSDAGGFRGVAVYFDHDDLLLVSEIQAGWYRYVCQWTLRRDGTMQPRFGFAATSNPCTCQTHVHHCYWRLDFGIGTEGNNRVEEFNDPPLTPISTANWEKLLFEASRSRDASHNRHWRVTHAASGKGYLILPGPNDGVADFYGAGDTWFVQYHPDEISDGQGFTSDEVLSRARIDLFVNGEPLDGQDVVAWYAGHFLHAPGVPHGLLGPDLVPLT